MLILLFFIITALYLFLIGSFAFGFDKVVGFKLKDTKPQTSFSVIIPFRNEAKNLPELLASILALNYPKQLFEIILVNDDSSDTSVEIINAFITKNSSISIRILQNKRVTNSPKKDAITTAIAQAKNQWIVTTDADCILAKYWLDSFDAFIKENALHCIIAPVTYSSTDSFLKRFQLLDFLSLIGATIGGFGIKKPFLCNGANFAYSKAFFNTVNGFEGNTTIASGDDIFLLEKAIKHNSKGVRFLKTKHAIVRTKPQPNFKNLIDQRKRWASKTSSYTSVFGKLTGVIVLAMNGLLICGLVLACVNSFSFKTLLYLFVLKTAIDFLLLFKTARFFGQEFILNSFLTASILYPFFNVYVALLSLFTTYKWKGRRFSK